MIDKINDHFILVDKCADQTRIIEISSHKIISVDMIHRKLLYVVFFLICGLKIITDHIKQSHKYKISFDY